MTNEIIITSTIRVQPSLHSNVSLHFDHFYHSVLWTPYSLLPPHSSKAKQVKVSSAALTASQLFGA
ncbi:uncharacterized protein EAF01_001256 [Botrytis porri]|uniref:uncharacterized protein n=1 Tax=Botrytis porri TaxID=87229 RepID=UPI0019025603|nr:uncharacterized protein EAF01_001256 [Botrytis porri]KAF7912235.1 hypothetical protein EAF01_001256 [Botrytis porri]